LYPITEAYKFLSANPQEWKFLYDITNSPASEIVIDKASKFIIHLLGSDANPSSLLWRYFCEALHSGTKIKQIDPLAGYLPILLRMQKRLRGVCDSIRRLYCVLSWEDSLLSFGLTFACLIAGTLLLVLPWEFILYHVCRICVWTFLGPWMKLVDVYIIKHDSKLLLDGDERKKV